MRKTVQLSLIAIACGLIGFGCVSIAMAQGIAPPDPEADTAGFLRALYDAATTKQWTVLAGLAMIGVTYAVRRWVLGSWEWAQSRVGGFVIAAVLSLLGTFGLALGSGAELSVGLVLDALGTAMAAAGGWTWLQHATAKKPVQQPSGEAGGN